MQGALSSFSLQDCYEVHLTHANENRRLGCTSPELSPENYPELPRKTPNFDQKRTPAIISPARTSVLLEDAR
jgi:hypothetical protein